MWLHLVNTCVFNNQILHQKRGGKLSALKFLSKLISQKIEKYEYDTDTFQKGGRPSTTENPFRLVERHFPSYVPATEKKANATLRWVECKKHGARRENRYECVRCDVACPFLCASPCFERYHKVKVFQILQYLQHYFGLLLYTSSCCVICFL